MKQHGTCSRSCLMLGLILAEPSSHFAEGLHSVYDVLKMLDSNSMSNDKIILSLLGSLHRSGLLMQDAAQDNMDIKHFLFS